MQEPRPLTHRERGRLGAAKRWADHVRPVRLDRVDPETRALILALLAQSPQIHENEKAAEVRPPTEEEAAVD